MTATLAQASGQKSVDALKRRFVPKVELKPRPGKDDQTTARAHESCDLFYRGRRQEWRITKYEHPILREVLFGEAASEIGLEKNIDSRRRLAAR